MQRFINNYVSTLTVNFSNMGKSSELETFLRSGFLPAFKTNSSEDGGKAVEEISVCSSFNVCDHRN